jgi:hypothetical protein
VWEGIQLHIQNACSGQEYFLLAHNYCIKLKSEEKAGMLGKKLVRHQHFYLSTSSVVLQHSGIRVSMLLLVMNYSSITQLCKPEVMCSKLPTWEV